MLAQSPQELLHVLVDAFFSPVVWGLHSGRSGCGEAGAWGSRVRPGIIHESADDLRHGRGVCAIDEAVIEGDADVHHLADCRA